MQRFSAGAGEAPGQPGLCHPHFHKDSSVLYPILKQQTGREESLRVNGPGLDHVNPIKQSIRDGLPGSGGSFLKTAEN